MKAPISVLTSCTRTRGVPGLNLTSSWSGTNLSWAKLEMMVLEPKRRTVDNKNLLPIIVASLLPAQFGAPVTSRGVSFSHYRRPAWFPSTGRHWRRGLYALQIVLLFHGARTIRRAWLELMSRV